MLSLSACPLSVTQTQRVCSVCSTTSYISVQAEWGQPMGGTVRNQRTLCCFLLTCSSAGARLINYESCDSQHTQNINELHLVGICVLSNRYLSANLVANKLLTDNLIILYLVARVRKLWCSPFVFYHHLNFFKYLIKLLSWTNIPYFQIRSYKMFLHQANAFIKNLNKKFCLTLLILLYKILQKKHTLYWMYMFSTINNVKRTKYLLDSFSHYIMETKTATSVRMFACESAWYIIYEKVCVCRNGWM